MMRVRTCWLFAMAAGIAALLACGCTAPKTPEVVIYTSVDQAYTEPLLADFEAETGIKVRAVYDAEAAKTTALVNRLVAEKDRPRADVWWSGEIVQTLRLAEQGVLDPYESVSADSIPETFRDADGLWTGFGGRARILAVNKQTDVLAPEHVGDLTDPEGHWERGSVGMSDPRFGTASTHAAVLFATEGQDRATAFYDSIAARGVRVLDGNATVVDKVASGELVWGLTDTDDALGAIDRGDPVRIVVPDQGPDDAGALLIPNTVALVKGAPNPDGARKLIDWLLSESTEQRLVEDGWIQFPVRGEPDPRLGERPRFMDVDYRAAFDQLDPSQEALTGVFSR